MAADLDGGYVHVEDVDEVQTASAPKVMEQGSVAAVEERTRRHAHQ